jgi:hypothetical protein
MLGSNIPVPATFVVLMSSCFGNEWSPLLLSVGFMIEDGLSPSRNVG